MGITFVVNPGSTSRKYAWYKGTQRLLSVSVEATPAGIAVLVTDAAGSTTQIDTAPSSLLEALPFALALAAKQQIGIQGAAEQIVALRVVAPGEQFAKHQWLNNDLETELEAAAALVPLHIPIIQAELKALGEALPGARIALVSDSAFHTKQDARVRGTGLTTKDEEMYGWRRFGYHGLSVASVARTLGQAATGVPLRTVVCHLGGGVSVTALRDGVSVATTMGLTPASGIAMGTRGGDITADELAALLTKNDMTASQVWQYLYRDSGWQGKAGCADLRALIDGATDAHSPAAAVLERFVYQVQAYIAEYLILLGGLDRVVLTGTAAVRNSYIRARIVSGLAPLGILLDTDKNDSLRGNGVITTADSAVAVEVIANDEFGEMARTATALGD